MLGASNVSYKEVIESRTKFQEARQDFSAKYNAFLVAVLKEAGVYNKIVQLKDSKLRGQFMIENDNYYSSRPWTIKFHPMRVTCDEVSRRCKYLHNFYPWREDDIVQQIINLVDWEETNES